MAAATTALDGVLAERLQLGARSFGVVLDPAAMARFGRYLELLREWNRRINLTAVDTPVEVIDRHFLDSLAVAPLLADARTLVDVGAGAGFPGAVLAIALPGLQVIAVEATHKKVAFLQTLRRELDLSLEPLCTRDDTLRGTGRTFDAAISRATWEPGEWLAHGAPLVGPGGLLIAMTTRGHAALPAPPGFDALPSSHYAVGSAERRIDAFRRGDVPRGT
jgi:16S rRNA (guanine527-N7)-methyltransferase